MIRVVHVTVKARNGERFNYDVLTKNILRKPRRVYSPDIIRDNLVKSGAIRPTLKLQEFV